MAKFTLRPISPFKTEILRNGKRFDTAGTYVAAKIRIVTLELMEELRATN